MLEVLDSRLLSVLAWYHLSFLAVSVAMLGMAAGAVLVFVLGERVSVERAASVLPGATAAFALVLAIAHLTNLTIPFPPVRAVTVPDIVALGVATAVLTLPFILSGFVVTLVLTRTAGPIGLLYGADLIGAAVGCLAIIGLLNFTDLTSTALVTAGVAALGAWCFARAGQRRGVAALLLAAGLFGAGWLNAHADPRLGVLYPKNRSVWPLLNTIQYSAWNAHSYVFVRRPERSEAWLWGPGKLAPKEPAIAAWAMIDGEAGTPITKWDGNPSTLNWVQYDVTALPYRIRHGNIGIIGVGGGRDLLTAIWARNHSITGIEINQTFIDVLTGPFRAFAGVADSPGVTLVHDEARSYLTRTSQRFDVLQMSLIDTWAATGAGAFTLTENGLYTREGWRVFLRALTPSGVFSVSRWYAPGSVSETTRLLSLGVASLLDAGVKDPSKHLVLVGAGHVATLMVSLTPFSAADGESLQTAAGQFGFDIQVSPWMPLVNTQLSKVAHATSLKALNDDAFHWDFDFTPPTDARPFFFNMLKPRAVFRDVAAPEGGVITGNLVATSTLFSLLAIVAVLVAAVIVAPLAVVGRPRMPPGLFGSALLYFALIGLGFMFIQIPFLQRFSVHLGHPTYTFSIILFLMILAAGAGSLASERVGLMAMRRRVSIHALPFAIAGLVLVETALLQPAMDLSVGWELAGRSLVVAVFVVPLAFMLGLCFPIGMRLVERHSPQVTAWMWGVNGACGVLASIVAVMISLWWGIQANLFIAAALYAMLALPMKRLGVRE